MDAERTRYLPGPLRVFEEIGTGIRFLFPRKPPSAGVYTVEAGNGRQFRVMIEVEENAPHRITVFRWDRVHPFDLKIREAGQEDGDAVARISYNAGIVVDDVTTRTRYTGDYFAAARLMEDAKVLLAEVDGERAAYSWAACHRGRIGGVSKRLGYFLYLRVLPEHQGKGLWGSLNRAVLGAYPQTDAYYGTFSPNNVVWRHESQQRGTSNPGVWRHRVYRFQIDVHANAANAAAGEAGSARSATPRDTPRIVELLNAFHDREELYEPYTVESFTARVERAPDLYGWDRLWLEGDAVMGVWPAGDDIEVLIERDGVTTGQRRGHVIDYAYAPGRGRRPPPAYRRVVRVAVRAWTNPPVDHGLGGVAGLRLAARVVEPRRLVPHDAEPKLPKSATKRLRTTRINHETGACDSPR